MVKSDYAVFYDSDLNGEMALVGYYKDKTMAEVVTHLEERPWAYLIFDLNDPEIEMTPSKAHRVVHVEFGSKQNFTKELIAEFADANIIIDGILSDTSASFEFTDLASAAKSKLSKQEYEAIRLYALQLENK